MLKQIKSYVLVSECTVEDAYYLYLSKRQEITDLEKEIREARKQEEKLHCCGFVEWMSYYGKGRTVTRLIAELREAHREKDVLEKQYLTMTDGGNYNG